MQYGRSKIREVDFSDFSPFKIFLAPSFPIVSFLLFFKNKFVNLANYWHLCHIAPFPKILLIGTLVTLPSPKDFALERQ